MCTENPQKVATNWFFSKRLGEASKCHLFLADISPANLAKFIIPHNLFELSFFPTSQIDVFRERPLRHEEIEIIYEIIIRKCRDVGMVESAEGWAIDYQKLQNQYEFGWMGRVFNSISEAWWNFGYSKWRILFIWTPIFFLLFCSINFITLNQQLNKLYFDPEIGLNHRNAGITTSRAMISYLSSDFLQKAAYTIHYTGVVFFGFKVKHEALNFRSFGWIAYFYFMYIVGLLHLAFSLNYIVSR